MKMIKRTEAASFLAKGSYPELKKEEFRAKKNAINGYICTAIIQGEIKKNNKQEISRNEFLWWASEKTVNKKEPKLRWPWIKERIEVPFKPVTGGGQLLAIEQSVVPVDTEELQQALLDSWKERSENIKTINELEKPKRKKAAKEIKEQEEQRKTTELLRLL